MGLAAEHFDGDIAVRGIDAVEHLTEVTISNLCSNCKRRDVARH
jgi:hypothetical protein